VNILRKHSLFFNFIQRILDVLIVLLVTWAIGQKYGSPDLVRVFATYGSLLLVVIFSIFRVYKSWRGISLLNQIRTILLAWSSVLFIFNIIILVLSNEEQLAVLWPLGLFRSREFLLWSFFVFVVLAIVRFLTKLLLIFFREKGFNQRSAVIVGAGKAGVMLAEHLTRNSWMGIRVTGFFDDTLSTGAEVKASPEVLGRVLGPIERCAEFSLSKGIDMVFVALPMRAEKTIHKLVWDLGTHGVDVFMIPDLFAVGIQKSKIRQMGEINLIDFNLYPSWKRTFDVFFSLIVIVITLPVWLMVAVLIKLEDGDPVFYKHMRVMESGKRFDCFKFRTMYVNADQRLKALLDEDPSLRDEWERTYKIKHDPRVTMVGMFLRKMSLDELPQFLNVLAGHMSVVGARPVVPGELAKYYNKTALTYCATKPGITGLWQCGKRSDTENYSERVELDHWYVLNSNIWLDIKIIFKTIKSMLSRRGAY
jgi:exopolysaccharide biosynthesis polyprenyl glycosylphosphotransferase